MKKLLLLITLTFLAVTARSQVLNFRWYDSVQVWPKFNIRNLPEGQSLDSLLSRNSKYNTQRVHPLQLPISNATQTALNGKFNLPTGNSSQTILGNGNIATPNFTAGNRISISGSWPNITIGYIEPSINQVSRNINTTYTISTMRQATVFYSIPVTATNPLLIGTSAGTALLEYSTNGGVSWTTAVPTSASSSVGLSVTIQLTTGGSNLLAGVVPANALVRIRTTTSGTATVGNATGQELY